ncbi:MAG: glycosyltransferase [Ruminococcus flavefaciens]|nr:glycosyltransferase [Ruminococcus flavefaciens]
MPYISIIIPVYNVEKYIRECLDSIIRQTMTQIEIIVVNDGSTDDTRSIVEEYKDERLRLINTSNHGVAHARNVGMEYVQGKYIMFQDGDDVLDENACRVMYDFAEENKLDVVKGGTLSFQEHAL